MTGDVQADCQRARSAVAVQDRPPRTDLLQFIINDSPFPTPVDRAEKVLLDDAFHDVGNDDFISWCWSHRRSSQSSSSDRGVSDLRYCSSASRLDSIAVEAGFYGLCTLEAGRNKRLGADDRAFSPSPILAGVGFLRPARALASTPRDDSAPEPTSGVRGHWEQFEIKRFTITARTSIRAFKEMLEE